MTRRDDLHSQLIGLCQPTILEFLHNRLDVLSDDLDSADEGICENAKEQALEILSAIMGGTLTCGIVVGSTHPWQYMFLRVRGVNMEISVENLRNFVRNHGSVSIVDSAGETRKLKDGSPDVWELVDKADEFHFDGKKYRRNEFAQVMEKRRNPKPLDYRAVPLDAIAAQQPPKKK